MMTVLGAGLVLLAAVGSFYSLRLALAHREQELLSWLAALRLLEREMLCGGVPLPRLCATVVVQGSGVAADFFAALAAALKLDGAGGLPAVWRNLLAEHSAGWHLLPADVAVLTELGLGLGQSDLVGQKKLLAVTEERLRQLADESAARYLRLGRLLGGLGWCCGLLIICLWL